MKKGSQLILFALVILQFIIFSLVAFWANTSMEETTLHTSGLLQQQALKNAESQLRERIAAVVNYIEMERDKALIEARMLGDSISYAMAETPEAQAAEHLLQWSAELATNRYGQAIQLLLHDTQKQRITLYLNGQQADVTQEYANISPNIYVQACPYHASLSYTGATLYIFATQDALDEAAKSYVYDFIHGSKYGPEGYVWVNAVQDYNGGDQYAIRYIHPNLKDTEGCYLSTNEPDIMGNLPYLTELEGIKANGEIFHTYYFQNKSDGQIAEKASYAELYEPFDWIIATGEPLDTLLGYTQDLESYNHAVSRTTMLRIMLALSIVCVVDILLIYLSIRRYNHHVETYVQDTVAQRDQIFNIVAQHSNRTVYVYDLATKTTRPWGSMDMQNDILGHLYTNTYSPDAVAENRGVLPDSADDVKMLFANIHNGVPSGDANIHIRLEDGQLAWYHFKYSLLNERNAPATALISIEDITERHEHELAHMRYVQSVEILPENQVAYIECDLTADLVENLTGHIFSQEERAVRCPYSVLHRSLLNLKFRHEDYAGASRYFSIENLLAQFARGERTLMSEWKVRYNDYKIHWLAAEITLMADPYNDHVKAYIQMMDITNERMEDQAIRQRADFDVMTGLLRKDVGEERVRKELARSNKKGGILILLDMDDLKGINDSFGHREGDHAIVSVAQTLKSHFRKDDILCRAGGDEFLIYLPGAGESVDAVELSMDTLLKKLSKLHVGENNARRIHCSAGCAVETPGKDTYDTLFQRADKALYHIKRKEKNNYAFYTAEMEKADYEFRSKQLLSKRNEKKMQMAELQYLLDSIIKFYQLVLSANLSGNTYFMMEEVADGVFSRLPSTGELESFIDLAARPIHPEDVAGYYAHLSREALLQAFAQGASYVRHYFRFLHGESYRWVECAAIFYVNESGETCDFTLLRWADDDRMDLEHFQKQ